MGESLRGKLTDREEQQHEQVAKADCECPFSWNIRGKE